MADLGWIDNQGQLRPRDWEEHCKYFRKIPAPQGWEHKPQTWAEYCRMVVAAPDWPTTQRLMEQYHDAFELNSLSPVYPQAQKQPKLPPVPRAVYDPPRESQTVLRTKRRRLLQMKPHCFWCGCLVVETLNEIPNKATIDHLYSRHHPYRTRRHSEAHAVLHVLACYACNQSRAMCELKGIPFIPRLAERLEIARLACAVNPVDVAIPESRHFVRRRGAPVHPRRVLCTIEEAIAFAQENPSR